MRLTCAILVVFLLGSSALYSQSEYLEIRKKINIISCTKLPSLDSLMLMKGRLESVDTVTLKKDLSIYYHDMGNCFWYLNIRTKDEQWKIKAIEYFRKAIRHDKKDVSAYWQIAFMESDLGHCNVANAAIKNYKKYCRKKYRDVEQVQQHVDRKCSEAPKSES